jgi:hypothetical protein
MTGERLQCATPGCRRTRKEFSGHTEWVCQKCYDRVPRETKREHGEAKRSLKRIARLKASTEDDVRSAWARSQMAWVAVKEAARGGLPDDDVLREIGVV